MYIENARRIVIKIGSALVVNQENGQLQDAWLQSLVEDVARLTAAGKEVIIVSSGAVALGRRALGLKKRTTRLEEKQAAAACGQIALLHGYKEHFARHNIQVAQILLTIEDSENRRRYLNARNTLETLIKMKVIPIINENDTVATAELRFGDNDRLAARVAQMTASDVLVLLSDIDGLYTANPQQDSSAILLPRIEDITPEIEQMAGGSLSDVGSGGMITKIAAAKIAVSSGCHMAITAGKTDHPLHALMNGARASWFTAKASPMTARKNWIASSLCPVGEVTIDNGALSALQKGKSLLPAGVTGIIGQFNRGDAVRIRDKEGAEIGLGIVAYSSADAQMIIGRKSSEIAEILGFSGRDELIHRDDLALKTV